MIVVDSSVLIDNLRDAATPQVQFLRDRSKRDRILVGDICLLEILRGARSDDHATAIEGRLRELRVVPMLSPDLARSGARNYRRLRSLGITTRKVPDAIIATYCIESGHTLLHNDRDFDPFARHLGLKVVDVSA